MCEDAKKEMEQLIQGIRTMLEEDADIKRLFAKNKNTGLQVEIAGVGKVSLEEAEKLVGKDVRWSRGESGGKSVNNVYVGVKQASKYLKEQEVPRQYRKQILESFDIRTIRLGVAGENTYGLRFYGGNANAEGRYLFETFSSLTNRENLALPYEWNSMTGIQQFQVKKGTKVIIGAAAPQSSFESQYIGGANQWYINNLEDLVKCQ